MYRRIIIIMLSVIIAGGICFAQTNQPAIADDWKPSSLNQPGQQYPQVNSQGYARFRIVASQAQNVAVNIGGTILTKGDDVPGPVPPPSLWTKVSITTISRLMVRLLTITVHCVSMVLLVWKAV